MKQHVPWIGIIACFVLIALSGGSGGSTSPTLSRLKEDYGRMSAYELHPSIMRAFARQLADSANPLGNMANGLERLTMYSVGDLTKTAEDSLALSLAQGLADEGAEPLMSGTLSGGSYRVFLQDASGIVERMFLVLQSPRNGESRSWEAADVAGFELSEGLSLIDVQGQIDPSVLFAVMNNSMQP